VAGRSESLQPAADRMNLLNKRVQELGDLRSRSVEICAANPDFIP